MSRKSKELSKNVSEWYELNLLGTSILYFPAAAVKFFAAIFTISSGSVSALSAKYAKFISTNSGLYNAY